LKFQRIFDSLLFMIKEDQKNISNAQPAPVDPALAAAIERLAEKIKGLEQRLQPLNQMGDHPYHRAQPVRFQHRGHR
jgi:hypothetical protein